MADEHFRTPALMPELTARTSATNHFNRIFQALSENVFIRADIALSALDTFLFNRLYYKFTFFARCYGSGATSEYRFKLVISRQRGPVDQKFLVERSSRPTILVVSKLG